MFDQCQRKWAHAFLYKSQKDEVSQKSLKIGIAMHSLIENFYLQQRFEKQWLLDNWEFYYKKEMFANPKKEDLNTGYKALENLYKILNERDWLQPAWSAGHSRGVEYYFKFPFMGHHKYQVNISGKIDLLIKPHEDICVVDWKTGKSVKYQVETLEDSIQLILYSVALKKMLSVDNEKLYLVYFYANKVKEFEVENEHFELVKNKINNLLDVYDKKKFSKTVDYHCNQCEYRSVCQGKTGSIMI